jgi:tight adherence protein B
MSDTAITVFIAMVFLAVFFLAQGMIVPVFGESRQTRRRLKQRLGDVDQASEGPTIGSLLREKYLRELSPLERRIESMPFMESLAVVIEQAGHTILAYRLVLIAAGLAVATAAVAWTFTRMPLAALGAGAVAAYLPFMKIMRDRAARIARFEEQLPDAIDVMRRALMAGHPFNAAIKLVSEDMEDPIAREFELTFSDLNYGNDVRRAMLGLLARVPSVTLMAMVTSVLVQRETGGNLAEIFGQISSVIRGRFRFQRRVRTLTAEGRMSAWILALVPLVLFVAMLGINPDYMVSLVNEEMGRKLLLFAFVWGSIGIYFIRRIIRIEV